MTNFDAVKAQHLLLDETSFLDLPYLYLSKALYHHLFRVLRINVGDHFCLCDQGKAFYLTCKGFEKESIEVSLLNTVFLPAAPFSFHLFQALPKQDKFSEILRANVELGLDEMYPLQTQYCDVKTESISRKKDRWERILYSAALQSKRKELPRLRPLLSFDEIEFFSFPVDAIKILFWEGAPSNETVFDYLSSLNFKRENNVPLAVFFLIGPEGGLDQLEVTRAQALGFKMLSLGKSVLRVEHASIVALSQIKGYLNYLNSKN